MPRELVELDGIEVEISRAPGKPLLLLTRMAARDAAVWDGVWNRLTERFTVAHFDLRLPTDNRLENARALFGVFADRCALVANGLGYDGFHIFGWIGGTHVALRCAVAFPDRVRSMTLLGPFHPLPDMRLIDKQLEFRRVMLEQPNRELYAFYWYLSQLTPDFTRTHFDEVSAMAKRRAERDRLLSRDADAIMRWDHALYRQWVSDEELATIKAPSLIVGIDANIGNAGPTIEMARLLHEKLPHAHFMPLTGARSLVLLEDPERFMTAADPFLATVAKAGD